MSVPTHLREQAARAICASQGSNAWEEIPSYAQDAYKKAADAVFAIPALAGLIEAAMAYQKSSVEPRPMYDRHVDLFLAAGAFARSMEKTE